MKPLISIVVPVFNKEAYIPESFTSILAQDFTDFECLCVDDGSTDHSLALLEAYAKRDARFKIIPLASNQGVGAARNAGINAAQGKYLCFMDPDDLLPPASLSTRLALLENYNAEASRGSALLTNDNQSEYHKVCIGVYPHIRPINHPLSDLFLFHFIGDHCCFLFKRDIILKHNIKYGCLYNSHEDVFFLMKLFFVLKDVTFFEDHIYTYRFINKNSLSSVIKGTDKFYAVFYMVKFFYSFSIHFNKVIYGDSVFVYFMQHWVSMMYISFVKNEITTDDIDKIHARLSELNQEFSILERLKTKSNELIKIKPLQDWFVKLLDLISKQYKDKAVQLAKSIGKLYIATGYK